MNSSPPSSISCSLEHADAETDDHSEVTWQCGEDDEHPSHADDFGITLAADPYFFYTLDKRHSPKDTKQQLVDLKLQIARQQERMDAREAENAALRTENAALRAENAQLVRELSLSRRPARGPSTAPPTNAGAALAQDHARLAVTVEVMRKSLKAQIDDGRKSRQMDEALIAELQRTNDSLRRSLRRRWKESTARGPAAAKASAAKLEASVCTATTASESFSDREASRRHSSFTLQSSLRSIPEDLRQLHADDCTRASGKNGDKIVDLLEGGEAIAAEEESLPETRRPRRAVRPIDVAALRRYDGFAEDPTTPRRKSEELLVGFDEAQRSQIAAFRRRWSGLKK